MSDITGHWSSASERALTIMIEQKPGARVVIELGKESYLLWPDQALEIATILVAAAEQILSGQQRLS